MSRPRLALQGGPPPVTYNVTMSGRDMERLKNLALRRTRYEGKIVPISVLVREAIAEYLACNE